MLIRPTKRFWQVDSRKQHPPEKLLGIRDPQRGIERTTRFIEDLITVFTTSAATALLFW
jgi:hypothetical protein